MRILDRPRPVLFWLRFLVVICVVPTSATTALGIKNFYEREHNTLAKSTVRTASDLMQAVELDLASATAALQVLAMSRDLDSGNLAAFRDCAREALLSQTGNVIVLTEATGQQLMSTLKPYGEPLPRTGVPELLTAVLNTAKPSISDFFIGATSRQPQVAVSVPVIRDGKVTHSLTMGILPDRLQAILRDQHLPPDWVVSVFDRHGTIIARTHAPDQFVGHQGSPDLLRRMQIASEGILEGETLEHVPVLGTFSRSNLSGWAVAIGIPTAGLFADLRRSLWLNVAEAGAFLGFALLLAWVVSLRIAGSIRVLSEPALALASAVQVVVPPVYISEVDDVGRALAEAGRLLEERTAARDRAQEQARAHQAELAFFSRISLAGEMAVGIAHELSQPLTAIAAYGRGCLRFLAAPEANRDLLTEGAAQIVQQAERAGKVLARLRDFVRPGAARRRPLQVEPLIDAAVALASLEPAASQVQITVRADAHLSMVFVDGIQVEQVLLNLLRNAIDAILAAEVNQGRIIVKARRKGAERVEVSVADNGPGISDRVAKKIFDPFVTTKPRGMGMGLSISRSMIEAHGGTLRLVSGRAAGAKFKFDLPVEDSSAR